MPIGHNKLLFRYIFYFLLFLATAGFFYLVRGVFVSFILAAVLVYLLYPLVGAMERKGTPRVVAILLAYCALLIIILAFLLYVVPRLVSQLQLLLYMLPTYTAQVEKYLLEIQRNYSRIEMPAGMRLAIDGQIYLLQERLQYLLVQTVQAIINLASHSIDFLLAPVLAFYILKDIEHFKGRLCKWLPKRCFKEFWSLGREINQVLINFIQGNLLLVVMVGVMTGTVMALLGIEYAVMLGIIAGIAELIPYFGPFIGAVPALVMGLLQSKFTALKVVLAILIVQQIEGHVLAPKVLGNSVGLHPVFIILVLIAGTKLYGIAGMLLAVPIAAILRILVVFIYKKIAL